MEWPFDPEYKIDFRVQGVRISGPYFKSKEARDAATIAMKQIAVQHANDPEFLRDPRGFIRKEYKKQRGVIDRQERPPGSLTEGSSATVDLKNESPVRPRSSIFHVNEEARKPTESSPSRGNASNSLQEELEGILLNGASDLAPVLVKLFRKAETMPLREIGLLTRLIRRHAHDLGHIRSTLEEFSED